MALRGNVGCYFHAFCHLSPKGEKKLEHRVIEDKKYYFIRLIQYYCNQRAVFEAKQWHPNCYEPNAIKLMNKFFINNSLYTSWT